MAVVEAQVKRWQLALVELQPLLPEVGRSPQPVLQVGESLCCDPLQPFYHSLSGSQALYHTIGRKCLNPH
jgi:hypothetical protein